MVEIFKTTIYNYADIVAIQRLLIEHFSNCYIDVDKMNTEVYIQIEAEDFDFDSLKLLIQLNGFPIEML